MEGGRFGGATAALEAGPAECKPPTSATRVLSRRGPLAWLAVPSSEPTYLGYNSHPPFAAEAIASSTSRIFSPNRAHPSRRNGRNTPRESGQRKLLKTQRCAPSRVQHIRALPAGAGWAKGTLPGFSISIWQTHCAGLRTAGSRTSTLKAQAGSRN